MNSLDFFNWSNNPWRGKPDGVWRIPGTCYTSATQCHLQDHAPLLKRPSKIVWQNMVGYHNPAVPGSTIGKIGLQLCAYGAQDRVQNSSPDNLPSFRVLKEVEFAGAMTEVDHRWDHFTPAEIDALMAIKFRYGLIFLVRHKSNDGTTAPVWHSSRLLVEYY